MERQARPANNWAGRACESAGVADHRASLARLCRYTVLFESAKAMRLNCCNFLSLRGLRFTGLGSSWRRARVFVLAARPVLGEVGGEAPRTGGSPTWSLSMRLTVNQANQRDGVILTSLRSWESLGQIVRNHTAEAVAMHLAAMADVCGVASDDESGSEDGAA